MPTVTGTFKDASGQPLNEIAVDILPTGGIAVDTNNDIIMPIPKKVVTGTDGSISVALGDGSYEFLVEGVTLKAAVPDQTDPVALSDNGVITNAGETGGGAYQ